MKLPPPAGSFTTGLIKKTAEKGKRPISLACKERGAPKRVYTAACSRSRGGEWLMVHYGMLVNGMTIWILLINCKMQKDSEDNGDGIQ